MYKVFIEPTGLRTAPWRVGIKNETKVIEDNLCTFWWTARLGYWRRKRRVEYINKSMKGTL